MAQENEAYNAYLLAQPVVYGITISGALRHGEPFALILNIRHGHDSHVGKRESAIMIAFDYATRFAEHLIKMLDDARHPDILPAYLAGEIDLPDTHPLIPWVLNPPPGIVPENFPDDLGKLVRIIHIHDFTQTFVLEVTMADSTTESFCVLSPTAHLLASDLSNAIDALNDAGASGKRRRH